MPLDRTKLNHLSTYARLSEQHGNTALTAYDLEEPQVTEDTLRSLDDLLEKMRDLVAELLAD